MNGKDESIADDKDREREAGAGEKDVFEHVGLIQPPCIDVGPKDPEERMMKLAEDFTAGTLKHSKIEASWLKPADLKELKIVLSTTPETLLDDIAKVKKALEWGGE